MRLHQVGGLIFAVYLAGAVRERRSLRGIAAEPAAAGHLTQAKYCGSNFARPVNQGTKRCMAHGRRCRSGTRGSSST